MKALITGSNGFIGKAFHSRSRQYFSDILYFDDITDRENWQKNIKSYLLYNSPDVIFHIGACSDTQNFDVNEMMTKNVECTMLLADYANSHNIPIIFSSSASCYGNGSGPLSLYAWSKYIAEQYVIKCGGIALRYFNVFGYNEAHKGKMASFPYQAFQARKEGKKVMIFPSKGEESRPKRDFVYVEDVISANFYAFNHYERLKGSFYDVGSGLSISYEDLLDYMQISYEYTDYGCIPINYQYYTKASSDRFMKGWNPNWRPRDGLIDYINILESL